MASWKTILIVAIVFIILMQALTAGIFLERILPGWQEIFGQTLCNVGGFVLQPIWEVGPLKIPLPTSDDVLVGTFFASAIGWLWIRRTQWAFKRKLIAFIILMAAGMYIYKGVGMILLWYAEVVYGKTGCVDKLTLGPLGISYEIFDPLFLLMLAFSASAAISAIWAFKRRGGNG
jgi:hypothetical protein